MVNVDRDNWGGNVHYRAAQIVAPETLEEAQQLVASSVKVRPLGTRHSFNRLPDTDGILIHLGSLPHISVAGAVSTGTHGSGDGLGSLSSAVRGLQLIGPSGDPVDGSGRRAHLGEIASQRPDRHR